MPLTAVTIKGYRSVRRLHLPIETCAVFVGANGVGKTNLYKALGLLYRAILDERLMVRPRPASPCARSTANTSVGRPSPRSFQVSTTSATSGALSIAAERSRSIDQDQQRRALEARNELALRSLIYVKQRPRAPCFFFTRLDTARCALR